MYTAKTLYNKLRETIEDWETKKPESNEEWQVYIAKFDEKYGPVKKLFFKEYNEHHRCCPECGSDRYNTTLLGNTLDLDKMDEYKDVNKCICLDCGHSHRKHDRVKMSH